MMLLAVALLGMAPEPFRAVQYAARPATLRGCAECKGEPDDACEVRAGVQMRSLEEYAQKRWSAPGRIKLLRSNADTDCAVPARSLFGARASVELAAIRMAAAAPSPALLEKFALGPAVHGWPRKGQDRKTSAGPQPDRAALRAAVLCWPSERGWPQPVTGADARAALDKENSCELWLVAVHAATGEPDLEGASFPFAVKPFPPTDAKWAAVFDPAMSLEDALVPPEPAAAAPAQPPAPPPPAAPQPCGDAARGRSATLDRFDQWDRQIRGAAASSLDRASLTLNAAVWSGHCQELDVLRAALDQQLGCATPVSGKCRGAGETP